jgi:uncharacterized protein (TIGR03435 family)
MANTIAGRNLAFCAFLFCVTLAESGMVAQEFDVASVKANKSGLNQSSISRPGGQIIFENVPLRECIGFAYGIGADQDYALSGPAWLNSEKYDIVAKVPPNIPREQVLLMLRTLLGERFRLELHHESKELRGYALVAARGGPKLKRSSGAEGNFTFRSGHIVGNALSMSEFANRLSGPVFKLGTPVVNSTGLTGTFDFALDWEPDDTPGDHTAGPSLFMAIQEQLGLKLEPSKSRVEVLVVDHAERVPIEN